MGLCRAAESYKPHIFLTLTSLSLAAFIVLLQSVISGGVSAPVLVVYEHLISTTFLFSFAFFFEKDKRPPLTFKILCWAFLLGFLQITSGQMLLTFSLRYIQASSQTIVLNTMTVITFILAIVLRRETFRFCSTNGQAKLWGIISSTLGATIMVVWMGPKLKQLSSLRDSPGTGDQMIGYLMVVVAILGLACSSLLLEHVTITYHAVMSLTAMISFCGTFQSTILAALMERNASAWKISFDNLELLVILYGGFVTTGLNSYVQTWCIHKKGPVFFSAFSPLLIVLSFLLETFVLRKVAHLGSIVGAVLVVVGLYFLLWAKANENKKDNKMGKGSLNSPLKGPYKPPMEQDF